MIQPTYGNLQTLFSNRVFRIPEYQRFYSWGSRQRADLFNDIQSVYKRGPNEHHFMATIVCLRTSELSDIGADTFIHYDIVDGQQRITSLVVLLKCIELALEEDEDESKKQISRLIVKGKGQLILLQTNNANDYIFNRFLRDGTKPSKDEIETHADKNVRDAINDSFKFIEEWSQNNNGDIVSLLRVIKNNLGFVIFDTEDQRAVYSIFEVLNSRGLSVDWLDKCKSSLMEIAFGMSENEDAGNNYLNELKNLWGKIYRKLALASIPGHEVMRVCATLSYGAQRGKPLSAEDSLKSFKDACLTPDHAVEITNHILNTTSILVDLDSRKYLGSVSDILHARILAASIMMTRNLNETERDRALDQWERVTFRIFGLAGKDSRHKVGDYVRLAFKIMNSAEGADRYSGIMSSLRQLGHEYPIEHAVNDGLKSTPLYDISPKMCRYILWKYEEHLQNSCKSNLNPAVRTQIWNLNESDSIEHIAPQNPEAGGSWDGKVINHEENCHRIGNLILIPKPLNSEAQRQGFIQKRALYDRDSLRMVREIINYEDWTLNEIEDRESKIIDWAKIAWSDLLD